MLKLSEIKHANDLDEFRSAAADRKYIIISDSIRNALSFHEFLEYLGFDVEETSSFLVDSSKMHKLPKQLDVFEANALFKNGLKIFAVDDDQDFIFFKGQAPLDADLTYFDSTEYKVIAFDVDDDVTESILRSAKQAKLKFWLKRKSYYKDKVKEADKQIAELQNWLNDSKKEATK